MSIVDELAKLDDLRRRGALNEAEFAQAKAALLNAPPTSSEGSLGQHLSDQLAEVKHQNELAQVDRAWEIERQQYLIPGNYGRRLVPTTGMGIAIAVVGGIFGVFWTVMAIAITGSAPNDGPFEVAKVIFPIFGVVFTTAAIGFGCYVYTRAQKYQQAFAAYRARREPIRPG
jgi:hypothetical protein